MTNLFHRVTGTSLRQLRSERYLPSSLGRRRLKRTFQLERIAKVPVWKTSCNVCSEKGNWHMVRIESQTGPRSQSRRGHFKAYGLDHKDNEKPLNQKALV